MTATPETMILLDPAGVVRSWNAAAAQLWHCPAETALGAPLAALFPPAQEALVTAVERAISVAASLAAAYLEVGWSGELCARGAHVAPGQGRMHEAKIARALALLPYTGDDMPFATLPPRIESVLVVPRGVPAEGRPTAQTVMDA